jgi:DNA-binding winged helix-turn-helix (wHTH) protein/Tol biopolymer transport system component
MSPISIQFYDFDGFRLDPSQKVLLRDGNPVPLTPKVFDTLEIFVENSGKLLGKDELMEMLWQDRFVEESNLTSNIKMLRKALGDSAVHPRFIETVQRRGYRFIADVKQVDPADIPQLEERNFGPSTQGQRRYVLISIAVVVLISIFGIAFMWVGGNGLYRSSQPKFKRLTNSGKITNVTVVPNGKSIVFSQTDGVGESLWLRQIDSGDQAQILAAQDVEFVGLTVSPDSQHIYYSVFSDNSAVLTLSRVAIDGGEPEQINGIDTDASVSFSPDGRRFAYTESHTSIKETVLKVADTDGTNQRILIKAVGEDRIFPIFRASPVAWSPDGGTIACAVQETDEKGRFYRILLVDPETGNETRLSDRSWTGIENITWKDPDNVAFIEFEPNSPLRRIWQISRKSGEPRQLTNDLNGYQWLSSAGGSLFMLQKDAYSSLHVAEFDENSSSLPSKQIFGETGVIESVGWSHNEKIFYNSSNCGKNEIWQINADGTMSRRLTTDSSLIFTFAVSPSDDSLVYSRIQDGKISLASADPDGQNIRNLTNGMSDVSPVLSPDGATVVFQRGTSPPTLWSVSTKENRPPEQLTGYQSTNPSISPDGKKIACHFMDYGGKDPHWKLGLIDSETHRLLRKLEFPMIVTQRTTAWNPGNDQLTVAFGSGENLSLYVWSLEDGTIRPIENVSAGKIGAFAWSVDGKRLAFSQSFEKSDVVSLGNF